MNKALIFSGSLGVLLMFPACTGPGAASAAIAAGTVPKVPVVTSNVADPLSVGEIATMLGFAGGTVTLPPSASGWNVRFELEVPGKPARGLITTTARGQGKLLFATEEKGRDAFDLHLIQAGSAPFEIPNPKSYYRSLRLPSTLPAGRSVLWLWYNPGQSGSQPGDLDFVQRVVVEVTPVK